MKYINCLLYLVTLMVPSVFASSIVPSPLTVEYIKKHYSHYIAERIEEARQKAKTETEERVRKATEERIKREAEEEKKHEAEARAQDMIKDGFRDEQILKYCPRVTQERLDELKQGVDSRK